MGSRLGMGTLWPGCVPCVKVRWRGLRPAWARNALLVMTALLAALHAGMGALGRREASCISRRGRWPGGRLDASVLVVTPSAPYQWGNAWRFQHRQTWPGRHRSSDPRPGRCSAGLSLGAMTYEPRQALRWPVLPQRVNRLGIRQAHLPRGRWQWDAVARPRELDASRARVRLTCAAAVAVGSGMGDTGAKPSTRRTRRGGLGVLQRRWLPGRAAGDAGGHGDSPDDNGHIDKPGAWGQPPGAAPGVISGQPEESGGGRRRRRR